MYFSCTTIRRSVTTSATLLIPKCTTRRWTLRRSNHSVAKRQQFSCALSTATLSLSLKMWFQRVGFDFSRSMSKYYFYCCTGTYEHESWLLFFFFVFSGSCSQETSMWYHVIRNVVIVVFWGTLLRPTARAVVLILNAPPCKTFLGYVRAYRRSPTQFHCGQPPPHLP